jgi:hypothetical protein
MPALREQIAAPELFHPPPLQTLATIDLRVFYRKQVCEICAERRDVAVR